MHAIPLDHSGERMNGEQTVELVIDPEVLGALYRRGRRRLRAIQSSSQAALKLDRLRGVLQVTGTKESISDVQRQLESISGSHMAVSYPVWAELMRTRAEPDVCQSAVARIQYESGCRIHIERTAQEIQLFGPKDTAFLAQHLLHKFERMCVEEMVEVDCPMDDLSLHKLEEFAQQYAVTLSVSEKYVAILGMKQAVAEAAKDLPGYICGQQFDPNGDRGKAARLAISAAISNLTVDLEKRLASTTMTSPPPILKDANPIRNSENLMQGAVMVKAVNSNAKGFSPHQSITTQDADFVENFACQTCGSAGCFCVNCGKPTGKMRQGSLAGSIAGCPTCGVVNFCAYCGHRTEKTLIESMGTLQNGVSEGVSYNYEPAMFCADQMQMMTMVPVQSAVNGATAVQQGNQVLVPVAMCVPYDSSCQQYLPVYAGN